MSAKWREQLRAGNINYADKKRLLDTGILDYSKEIAGIEKGNINLSKLTGVTPKTINQTIREDLVPAIMNGDQEKANDILELVNHVIKNETAATLINPRRGIGYIIVSPFGNKRKERGLSKQSKHIRRALTARHEINELILGQRAVKENNHSRLYLFCGSHMSPEIIIRESHDISIFSEEVKAQERTIRIYETFEFWKAGAEYGFSVPKKIAKKMMKKWSDLKKWPE